jgi:hypothetical protein
LEGTELHPKRSADGVRLFDPAEVAAVGAKRQAEHRGASGSGGLAARVFAMFDEGRTLPQIVRATEQAPEVIRALHREWSTPLGRDPRARCETKEEREHREQAEHERRMAELERELEGRRTAWDAEDER